MSYDAPPPPPPYGQPPLGGYGGGPYNPGNAGDSLRGATIQQAAERFFKKYAVFTGRASRSEFWYWVLINLVVAIVLSVLGEAATFFRIIDYIWELAIICPTIALGARRLHDIGRTGWWQLLGIIPCIGWIVLIVWGATPPKPEGDRYNA